MPLALDDGPVPYRVEGTHPSGYGDRGSPPNNSPGDSAHSDMVDNSRGNGGEIEHKSELGQKVRGTALGLSPWENELGRDGEDTQQYVEEVSDEPASSQSNIDPHHALQPHTTRNP